MKKRSILNYAIAAGLCLAFLGGCGDSSDGTVVESTESYWETQQFDDLTGTDFIKVGESGKMQLLMNPSTATIRWMDTSTGAYQDTNMSHDEGMQGLTNMEQSDLVVRYFAGSKNNNMLYYTLNSYDSYSMCISRDQVSYQLMDNGVRVLYRLGDDSVTYKNFPPKLSDERMQEYILQYLDDIQKSVVTEKRYTQLSTGEWLRNFSDAAQSQLTKAAAAELYTIFYEVGHYTDELLMEDLQAAEVEPDKYPSNLELRVAVEYYLDGEDLIVNLDTSTMETDADHPINQVQLTPYFLTSDSTNDAEEGYMFIPDGSGALIYLDSTKTKEYHYAGYFYGGDKLVGATNYSSVDNKMMMPVYGMKTENSTIFGIIEEGAEVAFLDAYVSGTDNSEPFSKIKLSFDIQTQQSIASGAKNAGGDFTMVKASDDVYDENITIRYKWLGEDADYLDMANCYAGYLEEKGVLTAGTQEEEAPFYVELLGSTDKTKYFLGIPYEGSQTLTTFKQGEEILRNMTDNGVKNVKLIYSGMVNGGMNQRSLASNVKLAPGLGGKSALNSLKKYADSVGATLFPNLQLQTAYTKTKISNDMAAWNIVNERGQIYSFNPVKNTVEDEADYPLYLISPSYLDKYMSKVKKSYSSKIGLNTMASNDLYTFIGTNYRYTQVSPSSGEKLMKDATTNFADGMTLMLSNPVSDAYAYSTYLTDIPTTDSGMRVLDASIPFTGLVLDGYKMYSSESLNKESTDVYVNFMHVLESNGAPKFTFIYEDNSILSGTEQENYFAVNYNYWRDKIGAYYEEYSNFYNQVKGAAITEHELYDRNDNLRVVTYSNGVKAYFNYSDLEEQIDGVTVPAFSYVIK
ncbi:MAG TPA: hypothetical protein DCZ91_08255 [Lachnospiraceae bacterium]|nr:hypothetical protein [Lachnospiraceae bacterium]